MTRPQPLPPHASDPARSRGRHFPEPESPLRTAFARDRDRLIHSTAFRRLRYKTQVFVAPEQDHFRVRLTHSLEVAQIARTIARALALDEDLAEVVALAHDLGHPPFGHSGEDALQRAMAPFGGFEHNGHAIRIVTLLESRTPAYDGLNLSWEVLEGLAKHNGPVETPGWALAAQEAIWPLELRSWPGPEAQVAALADDIAYNAHDLDDGLRSGLLDLDEARAAVPLIESLWQEVARRWPQEKRASRLVPQLTRDLIGVMVESLLAETRARLAEAAPRSVEDVRAAGRALVAFSPATLQAIQPLRAYLMRAMYTHPSVKRIRLPAEQVVEELFAALHEGPRELPPRWRERLSEEGRDEPWRARIVGDYVAGMTDRFAIREHRRLTGASPIPHENRPDESYF
ncbi:deoxyguanosinetriphosphate triphosphohydrolase [Sandaracinobacter sp. RS1-74]|uniref:deoxyguanosinetriphosphate triphosphohydrolase n=1 Tax=Sandaracinobacteroides sayramensis TaxID=2913411 RepID=UPI001EDB0CC6|nr:deoxyguanosinetriphosphate triphosphohydrolase [Sandaracinobacteroides sayramensis]MCG2842014.1 deoxyguanosinetriphosphate triphosphohydrolase [Sandaracinobacteroides sayramensis]